jgi:hypothetical protein
LLTRLNSFGYKDYVDIVGVRGIKRDERNNKLYDR